MFYGLTYLGIFHTAVSIVAVIAGLIALVRDKQITLGSDIGKLYVITTVITCVTGFGIFQHGGFGKPHALGIITLVVLAVALGAELKHWFGRAARYVAVVAYSATYLFSWIPGVTETVTRLPLGHPLLSSPEAPELQVAAGALFVIFLVGAALQVLQLRAHPVESLEEEARV
jgi:uncharacterized membrane protein